MINTSAATHGNSAVISQTYVVAVEDNDLGTPDLPQGVDYGRWASLVNPAAPGTFRDSLELLEFEPE